MASGNADGSIIIDTSLDSSGFKRGSGELLQAIRALTAEISRVGKLLEGSFKGFGNTTSQAAKGTADITDEMQRLDKTVKTLQNSAKELNTKLDVLRGKKMLNSSLYNDTQRNMDMLLKDVDRVSVNISKLGPIAQRVFAGDQKAVSQFDTAVLAVQRDLAGLDQKLENFGKTKIPTEGYILQLQYIRETEQELQNLRDEMGRNRELGLSDPKDLAVLQAKIDETKAHLDDLIDGRKRMEEQGLAYELGRDTEAYTQYAEAVAAVRERALGLQQAVEDSVALHRQEAEAAEEAAEAERRAAEEAARAAEEAARARAAYNASFSGRVDQAFERAKAAPGNMLQSIGQAASAPFRAVYRLYDSFLHVVAQGRVLKNTVGGLLMVFFRFKDALASAAASAWQFIKSLPAAALHGIASALKAAGKALLNFTFVKAPAAVFNGLKSALAGVADHAKRAAVSLARLTASGIRSGMSALVSGVKQAAMGLLGLNRAAGKANSGFKMNFLTLLRYGFGIRSVYFLVKRLRSALFDGLGQMTKYSSEMNSSVSSLISSLNYLKYSLAAAFAPIVNVIAPYVSMFMDMMADMMNTIGMFFAALTGKGTFMRAKKVQTDYAASLDKTSKSAKKAKKNVDDLAEASRQLAGFDELEILSDDSKNKKSPSAGSGAGGGGGGAGSPALFEKAAVDSAIADWVKRIKEMWANADYAGIGQVVAEQINAAFAKVNSLIRWDRVKEPITKYVAAFCEIFNSMVYNIDWPLIGDTFAQGFNTLLHTVDLVLRNVDWELLGKSIAEGLNGAIHGIEWDLLGQTIADYLSAKIITVTSGLMHFDFSGLGAGLAEAINNFVDNLDGTFDSVDWWLIGNHIAEGVNNAISDVDWSDVGDLLGSAFNGVLGVINGAVTTFNWAGAGRSLADGVNTMVRTVDWKTLGNTINESVVGAFTLLAETLKGINWGEIGNAMDDFAEGLDLAGIAESITTALDGVDLNSAVSGFGKRLSKAFEGIDWYAIGDVIGKGLGFAFRKIADFIDSFDWKSIGTKVGAAINGAMDGFDWRSLGDTVGEALTGAFDGLAGIIEEVNWQNVGSSLAEGLAGIDWGDLTTSIAETIGAAVGGIAGTLQGAFEDLGGYVMDGFKDGIWEGIKNIGSWIWDNIVSPFIEGFKSAFGIASPAKVMIPLGQYIIEGMLNGMIEAIKGIKDWLEQHVLDPIRQGLDSAGETITIGIDLVKNWGGSFVEFVTGKKDAVIDTVIKRVEGWKSTFIHWLTGNKDGEASTVVKRVEGWTSTFQHWLFGQKSDTFTASVKRAREGFSAGVDSAKKFLFGNDGHFKAMIDRVRNKFKTSIASWREFLFGPDNRNGLITAKIGLVKGWTGRFIRWLTGSAAGRIKVIVDLVKGAWDSFRSFFGLSEGGSITAHGMRFYETGGKISKGASSFWRNVPKYASGTHNAHGTLFVAGEAGSEIVGNVNGRTEVLNKSQIAAAIYSAVIAAMTEAVNALGSALIGRMASNTNALISGMYMLEGAVYRGADKILPVIDAIEALSHTVTYTVPKVAQGAILPYSVVTNTVTNNSTSQELVTEAVRQNNDAMVAAVTAAITAQTNAIVSALQLYRGSSGRSPQELAKDVIDDINRRTLMFGQSPLLD